jgi:hypothetical protein
MICTLSLVRGIGDRVFRLGFGKARAVGSVETRPRTKREDGARTFIGAFGEVKSLGHPPGA